MGNTLGGKRTAKVMKINGETMKFKTPIQAGTIVKDYPNHAILDAESVKHYGIRAKPLETQQNLEPKRLYFLVEIPSKFSQDTKVARRVRSGINMSAKDRLESLMLSRRSVSDLSIMKPSSMTLEDQSYSKSQAEGKKDEGGPMRVKMRLPKGEVERLKSQCKNEGEIAQKIMEFCRKNSGVGNYNSSHQNEKKIDDGPSSTTTSSSSSGSSFGSNSNMSTAKGKEVAMIDQEIRGGVRRHGVLGRDRNGYNKKRVGFLPLAISEREIGLAVGS